MILTLEITQFCEHNCSYCSTRATESGAHLAIEEIEKFLEQYQDGMNVERINISGGEPLAHPDFYKILKMCEIIAPVTVYTNALTSIRYNTDVIKEIDVTANVILLPGHEVYLPVNARETHLLKPIKHGRFSGDTSTHYTLSGDSCSQCEHIVLQANGVVAPAPCKKSY